LPVDREAEGDVPMFIQTEQTPNPATLKFIPGREVMTSGTADFRDSAEAETSPLARRLFAVDGVEGVMLGGDFVSITKSPSTEWHHLKPALLGAIMEHFTSGEPVVSGVEDEVLADPADGELVATIRELLDTRVRPAVAQDGGDITFHGFQNGIVYLRMKGACAGCPSSVATLKHGIENMLRHFVPEVSEVRAV
jgi:Fe-S cluster biogenesis protein NfuA